MIRILGNISAIICVFILFINLLLYILKSIYFKLNIIYFKKIINVILPILSKYIENLIYLAFICLLIHISCVFNSINSFNLNYLLMVILFVIIIKNFFNLPQYKYSLLKKISSYIIILLLLIHMCTQL